MNLSGPGSITAIANLIVILGVLLAPFTILSFMFRLRGEMKRDAGERFETAAQLQNSINSLMVAFVTALMRDGVNRGIPVQGQGQQDGAGSKYENWSLYNDGFQLTAQQVPLLLENSTPVKKRRRSGNSVLIGVLSGVSIFLLLALITVLTVKI
jgi:hypothetical protein